MSAKAKILEIHEAEDGTLSITLELDLGRTVLLQGCSIVGLNHMDDVNQLKGCSCVEDMPVTFQSFVIPGDENS